MRIAIDAHALGGKGGGGATYIRNVLQALARIDQENSYTLLLTPRQRNLSIPGLEAMDHMIIPPNNLTIRIALALPPALLWSRFDLLHSEHMVPPLCPIPFVVTVHDISFERYPKFFDRTNVLKDRLTMPTTVHRAATVLTDSLFSKDDIVRRYRVSPERVVVAGCAADSMFKPVRERGRLQAIYSKYVIGGPFILCVGELQPRKNLGILIDAYVRLRKANTIQHKLVLVGRKAWLYNDIFATALATGYENDLIFTGYVPDDDLITLYNAADVFVYPSLFEGFGLPPLEAMACGTPVVTSNTSSLPEVVGDGGLMVDPHDAESLANAIAKVLHNPGVQERLGRAGLLRAAEFSWDETARILVDVYKRAVYHNGGNHAYGWSLRSQHRASRHGT